MRLLASMQSPPNCRSGTLCCRATSIVPWRAWLKRFAARLASLTKCQTLNVLWLTRQLATCLIRASRQSRFLCYLDLWRTLAGFSKIPSQQCVVWTAWAWGDCQHQHLSDWRTTSLKSLQSKPKTTRRISTPLSMSFHISLWRSSWTLLEHSVAPLVASQIHLQRRTEIDHWTRAKGAKWPVTPQPQFKSFHWQLGRRRLIMSFPNQTLQHIPCPAKIRRQLDIYFPLYIYRWKRVSGYQVREVQ